MEHYKSNKIALLSLFCFIVSLDGFYNNPDGLENIDWGLIADLRWHNTSEDIDRKRRKQAEFLVEEFVPFDVFAGITVMNNEMLTKVSDIISHYGLNINVTIEPGWYYN
jgi:hypothetical protein